MTSQQLPPVRGHDALSAQPKRESDYLSLLAVVNGILRQRRTVFLVVWICVGIGLWKAATVERSFTARASFIAEAGKATTAVRGLAAQFGFMLGSGEATRSPQFYADLVTTDAILGRVVSRSYRVPDEAGRAVERTLVSMYSKDVADSAVARLEAVRRLRKDMNVALTQRTGVIDVSVRARSPRLAQQILQQLLGLVDEFNQRTRQSQALAERQFTERRVLEMGGELNQAEEKLADFLRRNRQYGGSPELRLEFERLNREVGMKQELYTSMTQAFEQARIEHLRDTPVLTVIQAPDVPVRANPRGRIRILLTGLILGLFGGLVLAVIREHFVRTAHSASDEWAEFARLRRVIRQEMRHPVASLSSRE